MLHVVYMWLNNILNLHYELMIILVEPFWDIRVIYYNQVVFGMILTYHLSFDALLVTIPNLDLWDARNQGELHKDLE
jgi:hypothetical protein